MRKIYRSHGGNKLYWQQRWDNVSADIGGLNLEKYPGKYADIVMQNITSNDLVLEAGCGTGRVLYHYLNDNKPIIGMDFIYSALTSIKKKIDGAQLITADICNLGFKDSTFSAILAFGLYHNLEHDIDVALKETCRVLKANGILCASMRLDNFQNKITDHLADSVTSAKNGYSFHKVNLSVMEIREIFTNSGFQVQSIRYVENMSFLYKFSIFRHKRHKFFDEQLARAEGYKLNFFAKLIQRILMLVVPSQFSNIAVVMAVANKKRDK